MQNKIFIIICLTLLGCLGVIAQTSDNSSATPNCSNPIYSAEAFAKRNQTRPRYLDSPENNTLNYCKLFSNRLSCCNNATDSDIAKIFNQYKQVLSNITTKKFKGIKKAFEDYLNIDYQDLPQSENATEAVKQKVDSIKEELKEFTKNAVSCAKSALKITSGLLCSGCNPVWGKFVKNNRFVLSNNTCMALSNACYKLVEKFKHLKNESKADVANLTDSITEYIGEDAPMAAGNITDVNATDPNGARRVLVTANFDVSKYCDKWIAKKLTTAESCKVCYIKTADLGDNVESQLDAISPRCKENSIIKAALSVFSNNNPNAKNKYFDVLKGLNKLQETSITGFFPVVLDVTLAQNKKMTLDFGVSDNKLIDDMITLLNLLAPLNIKQQKINDLSNSFVKVVSDFFKSIALNNPLKELISKVQFEKLYNSTCANILTCALKAGHFVIRESKIKLGAKGFSIEVNLKGDQAGVATVQEDAGSPQSAKSKIVEFLNNCTSKTFPADISTFSAKCSKQNCIICLDKNCITAVSEATTKQPEPKNKTEASKSFDQVSQNGQDPKKVSPNTGRKVPDQVDIPSSVDNLTSYKFESPCSNVSDCSKWFCNKMINGVFARIEKVLNPQDSKEDIEDEASQGYNTSLSDAKRVLAETDTNDISSDGLNLYAVSEASKLDNSVSIDGINEPAPEYDPTIAPNTTLDATSAGTIPQASGGSGGSGSSGGSGGTGGSGGSGGTGGSNNTSGGTSGGTNNTSGGTANTTGNNGAKVDEEKKGNWASRLALLGVYGFCMIFLLWQ